MSIEFVLKGERKFRAAMRRAPALLASNVARGMGQAMLLAVKVGVAGWDNLGDGKGGQVEAKTEDQVIGTADGSTDQQIQLIKTYPFGSESAYREITKPVDSAVDYGRRTTQVGVAPAFAVTADNTPSLFRWIMKPASSR